MHMRTLCLIAVHEFHSGSDRIDGKVRYIMVLHYLSLSLSCRTSYRNIVLYSGGHYAVWGNQDRELAFVRRRDTRRRTPMGCHVPFSLHPDPTWPFPLDQHSCKYWVYQNTVVNIEDFGRVLDNLMASLGIQPMNTPGATGREEEFPHFTH